MSCSARGCRNRRGIKVHRFPRNADRRAAWTANMNRVNWTPTESARLCSAHFTIDQYEPERLKDLKLKTTAVPTIFDYDIDRRKRAKELLQHLKASLPDKLSDIEHAYAKKPEQEHLVIGPEEYPATKITSTLTIEMVPGQEDDIEEESEEPDGPEDPCDYYVENQDYEEGEFLEQEGEENEDNLRDPFEGVMEGITTTLTMTSDGKTIMEEASDEVIPEDVLHEDTPDEPSQVQEGNDADPVVQEQGNFDEQNGSLDDDLEEDVDGEEDSSEANKRQNESEEDNFQDHDPLQGNNLSERTMEETFEVYVNKNENVAVKDPFDSENEQDEEDLQDTDLNAETENNGFNSEASECDDGQENCDEPETNVNEGESTDPLSDPLDGLDLEVTEEDVDPYANARRDDQVVTKNKKKAQHKSPAPPEEASTKATEDTITLTTPIVMSSLKPVNLNPDLINRTSTQIILPQNPIAVKRIVTTGANSTSQSPTAYRKQITEKNQYLNEVAAEVRNKRRLVMNLEEILTSFKDENGKRLWRDAKELEALNLHELESGKDLFRIRYKYGGPNSGLKKRPKAKSNVPSTGTSTPTQQQSETTSMLASHAERFQLKKSPNTSAAPVKRKHVGGESSSDEDYDPFTMGLNYIPPKKK